MNAKWQQATSIFFKKTNVFFAMLKASLQNCNLVAFNAISLNSSFEPSLRYIALDFKF